MAPSRLGQRVIISGFLVVLAGAVGVANVYVVKGHVAQGRGGAYKVQKVTPTAMMTCGFCWTGTCRTTHKQPWTRLRSGV